MPGIGVWQQRDLMTARTLYRAIPPSSSRTYAPRHVFVPPEEKMFGQPSMTLYLSTNEQYNVRFLGLVELTWRQGQRCVRRVEGIVKASVVVVVVAAAAAILLEVVART